MEFIASKVVYDEKPSKRSIHILHCDIKSNPHLAK